MFLLKGCPRCGEDLVTVLDESLACIQCGYETNDQSKQRLLEGRPLSMRAHQLIHATLPAQGLRQTSTAHVVLGTHADTVGAAKKR
ncbi:MAG TPA: hypothetical protein VK821_05430 [Dehalococcoidia bacterium]|nr:hypothetical protein [Dehalococcoidia bacterium]